MGCGWRLGSVVGDATDWEAAERKMTPFLRRTDWRVLMSTSWTSTFDRAARAAAVPAASPMIMYCGSIRIEANATWLAETVTGSRRLPISDLRGTRIEYGMS